MMDFFDDHIGLMLAALGIVCLAALILGIRGIGHHYDNKTCHRFGDESGREVRFVDYSFWTWDCLTPTSDGKWISIDRLRDID